MVNSLTVKMERAGRAALFYRGHTWPELKDVPLSSETIETCPL